MYICVVTIIIVIAIYFAWNLLKKKKRKERKKFQINNDDDRFDCVLDVNRTHEKYRKYTFKKMCFTPFRRGRFDIFFSSRHPRIGVYHVSYLSVSGSYGHTEK